MKEQSIPIILKGFRKKRRNKSTYSNTYVKVEINATSICFENWFN
jgi:hypothetical protein